MTKLFGIIMMVKKFILKLLVFLFITITPNKALVEKESFQKEPSIVDVLCPIANLDLGVYRTVIQCASKCRTAASCSSFFFNKHGQFCKGAPIVLSTASGCKAAIGTTYYQTTDVTTTTSTTTTTTTTTVSSSQFGIACTSDSECTIAAGACLQNSCSCLAGYRYDPSSSLCVTDCASYGSTYIEHLNTELSVPYTAQYTGVTLAECQGYCTSSSTCRGVNYSSVFAGGMCRVKVESDPSAFMGMTSVNYYARNCS